MESNDWYMVGLACLFISAKLNSTHFGGVEPLLKFFYSERPRPHPLPQGKVLPDYKDQKIRSAIE